MDNYTAYAENARSDDLPDVTSVDNNPRFSGKIRYTCRFTKPDGVCGIDLGAVGQTSHLYLNGADLGVRVCLPYRYDLSGAIKDSENELVIEVSNTLANAVRDGFSAFLPIPASGLQGPVSWLKEV
ncbi:MAG: hypothetical protein IKX77_01215 [Clostridia bacterium]|nr:hypothetical protein [Clostridia bacterium]